MTVPARASGSLCDRRFGGGGDGGGGEFRLVVDRRQRVDADVGMNRGKHLGDVAHVGGRPRHHGVRS